MNKNIGTDQLITEIVRGIEEIKGQDIEILDLREIENTVCDYFVICNGTSNYASKCYRKFSTKISK